MQHLEMQTHNTEAGDCTTVTLKTKSLMGIDTVEECTREFGGVDPSHRVVVDMESVRIANSRFMSLLITCAKTADERGGKFVLCNVGREVQKLIDMFHLQDLLKAYGSVDEAVQALVAGSAGEQ